MLIFKILSFVLLTATVSLMDAELFAQTEELRGLAARDPRLFKGFEGDFLAQARKLQEEIAQAAQTSTLTDIAKLPLKGLTPFWEGLARFTECNGKSFEMPCAVDGETYENHPLSYSSFIGMLGKVLTQFGLPSLNEDSIFSGAKHQYVLHALSQGNGKDFLLKMTSDQNKFNTENPYMKQLPLPLFIPYFGRGVMGIPFLAYAAAHNLYPVACTAERGSVHGVQNMSPISLMVHDMLHALLNRSQDRLIKMDQQYAPSQLVQRFLDFKKEFQEIWKRMIDLHNNDKRDEFKKLMIGYFWLMRESSGYPKEMYEESDTQNAVGIFCQAVINKLNKPQSWENTYDPLKTSPISGHTGLSEDDVRSITGQPELLPNPDVGNIRFYFSGLWSENSKSGKTFFSKEQYPTMFHRFTNSHDVWKLLKWGGVILPAAPHLEEMSPEAAYTEATEHIDRIRNALIEQINYFKNWATTGVLG